MLTFICRVSRSARLRRLMCMLLGVVWVAGGGRAEDSFYRFEAINLPQVLCEFPGGSVSADDFKTALLQLAQSESLAAKKYFAISPPQRMVEYILADMLCKRGGGKVTAQEVNADIRKLEVAKGGRKQLEWELAQVRPFPLTLADLYRQLEFELSLQKAGLKGENRQKLMQELAPRWYGTGKNIVANVAGNDFTVGDLINYFLLLAGDNAMQAVLNNLLQDHIVLAEAEKMGFNTEGESPQRLLEMIFGPLITPQALQEYYNLHKKDYVIFKVAILDVSLPDVVPEQQLQEKIKALGKPGSEPPETKGYRYFCQGAAGIPAPELYGLDYVYHNGLKENPLESATPQLWLKLQDSGKDQLIALTDGQAGAQIGLVNQIIEPRRQGIFELIRLQRLGSLKEQLVGAVLNLDETRINWKPSDRLVLDDYSDKGQPPKLNMEGLPELEE